MDKPKLKIRIYEGDSDEPVTSVTLRTGLLKVAYQLIPKDTKTALQNQGIDLDALVQLADDPEAHGELLEAIDHKKNQRVVISLEE